MIRIEHRDAGGLGKALVAQTTAQLHDAGDTSCRDYGLTSAASCHDRESARRSDEDSGCHALTLRPFAPCVTPNLT